jgi:hypothetical protein
MPHESLKQVLMRRDGMSEQEADRLIKACKADLMNRLADGEMPDDILEEWFGLEPDYLPDIL